MGYSGGAVVGEPTCAGGIRPSGTPRGYCPGVGSPAAAVKKMNDRRVALAAIGLRMRAVAGAGPYTTSPTPAKRCRDLTNP